MITSRFLESLYGHVERGVISLFNLPSRRTEFYEIDPNNNFANDIEQRAPDLRDQNVYFGVGVLDGEPDKGRGVEDDVRAIPGLWVDIDVQGNGHKSDNLPPTFEDAQELIHQGPFTPTWVIYTGGGLHAYWLFHEPLRIESPSELEAVARLSERWQRHLAGVADFQGGWHIDPTYDLARIMRLPGTINQKYDGGIEVEEVEHSRARVAPMEIDEFLTDFGIDDVDFSGEGAEEWEAGEGGFEEAGGRNDRLKMIVSSRLQRGETLEDTVFEVLRFDAQNHDPPLFSDPTEFRSDHDYTNALSFVSNIAESINRKRERRGEAPQRFRFGGGREHNPDLTESDADDIDVFGFRDIYEDESPIPPDMLEPGLIAPSGFTLIAGPPKSGKSALCQDIGLHLAKGEPWNGFGVPEKRKIAFVNFEMSYRVLKTRIQKLDPDPHELSIYQRNWKVTDRFNSTLNDSGAERLIRLLRDTHEGAPDVIILDPMVNMYPGESESDNQTMMRFIKRLERVREEINPEAAIVLVHHARKTTREELRTDPFTAIRGAGALRGHYSAGMVMMDQSEESEEKRLFFESRIDHAPDPISLKFDSGELVKVTGETRVANQSQGARWDKESKRKKQIIAQEIARLSEEESRLVTSSQFSELYANRKGLGSDRSIKRKISEMTTKGYIAFTDGRDLEHDAAHPNSSGFLVVEGQQYLDPKDMELKPVEPTHKKHPDTGATIEFDGWDYADEGDAESLFDGKVYQLDSKRRE